MSFKKKINTYHWRMNLLIYDLLLECYANVDTARFKYCVKDNELYRLSKKKKWRKVKYYKSMGRDIDDLIVEIVRRNRKSRK